MPYTARFKAPVARVIISSRIPRDSWSSEDGSTGENARINLYMDGSLGLCVQGPFVEK